jgi:hypothetical protein
VNGTRAALAAAAIGRNSNSIGIRIKSRLRKFPLSGLKRVR